MSAPFPPHRSRARLVLLAAIIAAGAFLRIYRIRSLPPAEGYDAAYYGVDALQLLNREPPRLMYPPNREPLFSYLVAGLFLILGPSAPAIHATSALVGILTIPAVYLAADTLFRDEEQPIRRWGALLAALVVAFSYWHLNWSRLGMRAILVPLLSASTMAALWRGLQTRRTASFVAAGVGLGVSLYTYQAARLLPFVVLAGFAASAWKGNTELRHLWPSLLIVAGVALLVFAPLGVHFLSHPGSFSHRIDEALILEPQKPVGDNVGTLLYQAARAVLAFSFIGDDTPYSTIPGRPSLNPILSSFLLLGTVVSLWRVERPNRLVLLIWLVMMILPAALAGQGPTAKRAIGTLPAVSMLIALGALAPAVALWRWLGRRTPERARCMQALWTLVVLAGLAWTGWTTFQDYFVTWASNPNLPEHFEADISTIGKYIGELPPEERVYLSPELPRHPSIRFHSGLRADIRGYNGRVCFVGPGRPEVPITYVLVSGEGDRSLGKLETLFPQGETLDPHPSASFVVYHLPAGTQSMAQPSYPLPATWAERIKLIGYGVDQDRVTPGGTLSVSLFYEAVGEIDQRYTAFVHVLGPVNPDTGSPLWAQSDSEPCRGFYPTTSWHKGEILVDRIDIHLPPDTPAGPYTLGTGFYEVWSGERLPVTSNAAATDNNVLTLGTVSVAAD